jgi:predicted transposase/invertase (TIGR01784 family)
LPIFDVELIDIGKLSGEEIVGLFQTAQIKFSIMVMRYIIEDPEKIFAELLKFRNIVKELLQEKDGKEVILTTTIYISKKPGTRMENIVQNFESIEKQAGNIAKSAWEIEFEKGIKKGIEKTAKELLNLGFDINVIMQATGLTLEQIEKLKEEL